MNTDVGRAAAHRSAGIRSLLAPWRRKLKRSCPDALVIAALVALFLFAHRFVDGIDVGGDAVGKWQFVRQWSYANDFRGATWDHHMTRMGVNVVAWLAQKLFGSGWQSYYIAPMFAVALQLPFVYLLAKRMAGRLAGVLAALVITYLPAVQLTVSQLLPDGFVGTYALIATYLVVRLTEARARHRLALLVSLALVAFAGYLAKETFFFFYPGLVVALWLTRRSWRDVAIFLGLLALQLALETACYAAFTQYSSRLAIVRSEHFGGGGDDEPVAVALSGFLQTFRNLDREWRSLLLVAALGAAWLLLFNKRRTIQGRAIALVGVSHVALLSLSTQLWQRPLPRYMDPALPFAAMAAAIVSATLIQELSAQLVSLPGRGGVIFVRARALLRRWQVAVGGIVVAIVLVGGLTYLHQVKFPIFDGLAHGALMARLANRTYERNLPLVHATRRGHVLVAFYDVYLRDELLARDGVLPSFDVVKRRFGNFTYLVRDPSVYTHKLVERLYTEGCTLELRRGPKDQGMKGCADTQRPEEPPARCDALLQQLARRKK
jgi:hypothetical protein